VGHGQGTRYSARAAKRRVAVPIGLVAGALIVWGVWWPGRRCQRVEVSGLSMAPALQPGDRLVVWRTKSVHPGDIVAAHDPRLPQRKVLKRVVDVGPAGLYLLGDNPEHSTDSRRFGLVPVTLVEGRVVYRYAPPSRAGKLS